MCSVRHARRGLPGSPAARGRRATAPARPVNSEGRHHQSSSDAPDGSAGEDVGANPASGERRPMPPDDRLTSVIPAVTDDRLPRHADPVDAVKAALDAPSAPLQLDQLEQVRAALDSPVKDRRQETLSGRRPPGGPPGPAGPPGPPGAGAPGPQPHRRWAQQVNWKWLRRSLYLVMVMVVVLPLVTFAMAYFIVHVPAPGDIRTNQVSTILASDGSEIAKIVPPEGNRVDVNLNQVPVYVRQAVIAAEDRGFYTNPGFSFKGFARAIDNNLFGSGDLQGGSTITQQYVKNALVGSAQHGLSGLMRKAKELVIATKMSGEWSKDDVLQAYLNIIYFGRGAYGISAASKAYFD